MALFNPYYHTDQNTQKFKFLYKILILMKNDGCLL